jgi:hypothetical protein
MVKNGIANSTATGLVQSPAILRSANEKTPGFNIFNTWVTDFDTPIVPAVGVPEVIRLITPRWAESPHFIPKHAMCHDIQVPHSEVDNPTKLVSVTVSKLAEPTRFPYFRQRRVFIPRRPKEKQSQSHQRFV